MTPVLSLNVGSSSIKFALFERVEPPLRSLTGAIERIGLPGTVIHCKRAGAPSVADEPFDAEDLPEAAERLDRLARRAMRSGRHRRRRPPRRPRRPALLSCRTDHARAARRAEAHRAHRPRPSPRRDRAHRDLPPATTARAAGGLLRHRLPSRHAGSGAPVAGAASLLRARCQALRISRAVVRLPDARARAHRRRRSRRRTGAARASRIGLEHGGRRQRAERRHDDVVLVHGRPRHGHALGRSRSGLSDLPDAPRTHDARSRSTISSIGSRACSASPASART